MERTTTVIRPKRLTVESPDWDKEYLLTLMANDEEDYIWLTVAEADALIAVLQAGRD